MQAAQIDRTERVALLSLQQVIRSGGILMHVVAFVTHKQGLVEEGSEIQRAYTDYLRNHPDHPGIIVLHAGPTLADDAETIVGLLLVVEAPSLEAARAFLADSPYGKADVFAESRIQPWNWKTGRPG